MYSKRLRYCILTVFFVLFVSSNLLISQIEERIERIKTDLQYLASDELEGRLAGTAGNQLATEYIINQFKTIGLLPVNGSYKQEFKIKNRVILTENNKVGFTKLVEKPGLPPEMWFKAKKKWKLGREYRPVSISSNGTAEGEVAFVGYGITAKEINYDDYSAIDVNDKIVIIISDSAEGQPLDERFIKYSTLSYKAQNAKKHGAAGIIFVKRLSDSANTFYPLNVLRFNSNAGIPVIQATRTEIAKFFPKKNNLYPTELALMKTKKPQSFILPNVTVSITTELKFEDAVISNVIGMLKGTNPGKSQEYIVIGAHFDHIGHGEIQIKRKKKKLTIYNGADDNASGVSAVIELARRFKANPPRHGIIFVAFNAEELGLLGSSYFANNPPVDLSKIIAMFNFDMVGRLQESIILFGTETSRTLNSIVDDVADADSISIVKNKESYGPSDHTSFVSKNIPALFFFTGTHSDYNTPNDDYDKINFEGLNTVVDFAEKIIITVDNNEKPDYVAPKSHGRGGHGRGEIKVSFGSIPDFANTDNGFAIKGCRPGSPCEKSGMQNGDILTSFNGQPVGNIMEFTTALKEVSPGDVIKIIYIRNGKEITKEVKLDAK